MDYMRNHDFNRLSDLARLLPTEEGIAEIKNIITRNSYGPGSSDESLDCMDDPLAYDDQDDYGIYE